MNTMQGAGTRSPAGAAIRGGPWNLIGLLGAVALSTVFAITVLGWSTLDAGNTRWIWGDLSLVHLAWVQYLSDPQGGWLSTTAFSYPLSLSVALFDPVPLFLVLARWLGVAAHVDQQFLGWYFVACIVLQAVFAYFALGKAWAMSGVRRDQWTTVSLASLSVLLAAMPFTFHRFQGHAALSSQWVLMLSIWVSLCSVGANRGRWLLLQLPMVFALSGVNPYLSIMGVLVSLMLGLAALRLVDWKEAVLRGLCVLAVWLFGSWLFGFMGAAGLSGGGYGRYSMNLLGPLDSNGLSYFWPLDVADPTGGQTWEGFNYLGLGAVLFVCVGLWSAIATRVAGRPTASGSSAFPVRHVFFAVLVFFALSLSTKVSMASHVLELPVPGPLLDILAKFRASGRFFWMAGFLLVVGFAAVLAQRLKSAALASLSVVVLVVQLVDIQPIVRFVHDTIHSAARLPALELNRKDLSAIYVYPPWQCNPRETPGGIRNYELTGYAAVVAGVPTNNFYAARNPLEQLDYHCNIDARLSTLDKDAVYLLKNEIYGPRTAALGRSHDCRQASVAFNSTDQQELLSGVSDAPSFWICSPRN